MLYLLFPARAALNVSIIYSRRLSINSLFESGFRWRLFWDLNPVLFFITLPCFCTVSVSTTNETKSHFKAHFSLSFATVSRAVVSLYFKCALNWWHICFKSLCLRLSRHTQILLPADFTICILRWEPNAIGLIQ